MIRGTTPCTGEQVRTILALVDLHPDWSANLNGAEWENCWDVLGRAKFVSTLEAAEVIGALRDLPAPRAEDESCERGTAGCCVHHNAAPWASCETW